MYWIYLAIFILMVFAPDIIRRDFQFIGEERAEELFILFVGIIGFLIFLRKEKNLKINLEKWIKIQKEANIISRDLSATYNYVGEMNRKLDILKEIYLNPPETLPITPAMEQKVFGLIFDALKLFSKSNHFIIRFIEKKNGNILREIKNRNKLPFQIGADYRENMKNGVFENEKYTVFSSSRDLDGIESHIIIYRQNLRQKIKNYEEFKMLASRTLCLFAYSEIKKRRNFSKD